MPIFKLIHCLAVVAPRARRLKASGRVEARRRMQSSGSITPGGRVGAFDEPAQAVPPIASICTKLPRAGDADRRTHSELLLSATPCAIQSVHEVTQATGKKRQPRGPG